MIAAGQSAAEVAELIQVSRVTRNALPRARRLALDDFAGHDLCTAAGEDADQVARIDPHLPTGGLRLTLSLLAADLFHLSLRMHTPS